MRIGSREFDVENEFYIMGILNVTPDSFSDGGRFCQMDAALGHVERMLSEGCDIVDIGGESTRPGHIKISGQEEIDRVCPYIEAVKSRFDVPISLDTYKADVAEAGILAGADMVNDIWGLKWSPRPAVQGAMPNGGDMAEVLAKYQVAACLMHNRMPVTGQGTATSLGSCADTEENIFGYRDVAKDVAADLAETVGLAKQAGVCMEKVMLDPGIGFGKTLSDNLGVMKHLDKICAMGYPVLLGASRKSMIGLTLKLPVEEREEGTMATTVIGAMQGCSFFRVHDVKRNRRALDMTRAIMGA